MHDVFLLIDGSHLIINSIASKANQMWSESVLTLVLGLMQVAGSQSLFVFSANGKHHADQKGLVGKCKSTCVSVQRGNLAGWLYLFQSISPCLMDLVLLSPFPQ